MSFKVGDKVRVLKKGEWSSPTLGFTLSEGYVFTVSRIPDVSADGVYLEGLEENGWFESWRFGLVDPDAVLNELKCAVKKARLTGYDVKCSIEKKVWEDI